jgi:ATP-binding cassette subfamily B protein
MPKLKSKKMIVRYPFQLFVRQITEDSCGTACLAMILKYMGRAAEAKSVSLEEIKQGGLSLLEMQQKAQKLGLDSRCVEMDIEFLKSLGKPVILHTVNELGFNHFIVCFAFFKDEFVIADPATQVHHLSEAELSAKWQSHAALYFENISYYRQPSLMKFVVSLIMELAFPPGLLIVLPLLSLFVGFFGIALTWLLQKGITDTRILDGHVAYSLIALLFIICLFRNFFTFLRQYILIRLNFSLNLKLMLNLLDNFPSEISGQRALKSEVSFGFSNIQKMQNALSVFVSIVISDGFLTAILLISSAYILPTAGLINLIYVALVTIGQIMQIPDYLYQTSRTRLLSKSSETAFLKLFSNFIGSGSERNKAEYQSLYKKNLQSSQRFAVQLCRKYLTTECWGTIDMIVVLLIGTLGYESQKFDYQSLILIVIESYLITILMQRICVSFQQFSEGVDAYIAQFR